MHKAVGFQGITNRTKGYTMKLTLTLLLLSFMPLFGDILFEDDFQDGNADGWIELVPEATYSVNEFFRYEMSFEGTENIDAVSANSDVPEKMSVPDYSVLVEVLAHNPCDEMCICVRVQTSGSTGTGYVAMLRFDIGEISIKRFEGLGWINLSQLDISLSFEQPYWLRFECVGDSLRTKVWLGTPESEPDEWLLAVADSTFSEPGYFALLAAAWGGGSYNGEFDCVCVTTPSLSLNNRTWGGIKTCH